MDAYSLWSNAPYPLYMPVKHGLYKEWISPHIHYFFEPRNGQVGLLQQNVHSSSAICQQQNPAMLLKSSPMLWKTVGPSAHILQPILIKLLKFHLTALFLNFELHQSPQALKMRKQRSNLLRIMWLQKRLLQLLTLGNSAKSYVCESSDEFHNTNMKKTIRWKYSLNILIYTIQKVAKC